MNYPEELAKYAHILEEKKLVTGLEGNISMIDRENGLTYITPSRRMKLLLTSEMVSIIDTKSGTQVGGTCKKSSEYLLHEAIYNCRSDVNAVIHCHCPYLTAYAVRYEDFIVPDTCSLHEVFQKFECLPWGQGGTHDIHRGIEKALENSPICLLGGHGVVCCAEDLELCLGLLDAAEGFAKTLYIARSM